MPSNSPISRLADLSYDSMIEVLSFLTCEECCRLGTTSREMYAVTNDEKIWRMFSFCSIKGVQQYYSWDELEFLRNIFQFPSYKLLYGSLRLLDFNLNGLLRLMPSKESPAGGLCCSKVIHNSLMISFIGENGMISSRPDQSLRVVYSTDTKGLIAATADNSRWYACCVRENSQICLYEPLTPSNFFTSSAFQAAMLVMDLFSTRRRQPTMTFRPLPDYLQPATLSLCPAIRRYTSTIGLYTAPYGSHGNEILHLSIHSKSSPAFLPCSDQFDFGNVQLQALKISGDPNVPANRISFCINLELTMDPTSALLEDSRPIITFNENGIPRWISLEQRLPNVVSWARGYGQINRDPSHWAPEWVGCTFVLMKNLQPRFCIVWDDETAALRHSMDFLPLPNFIVEF